MGRQNVWSTETTKLLLLRYYKVTFMRKLLLLGLLGIFAASDAMAATDGSVGPTSAGTADLSVTIPQLIRIRGLRDFTWNYTTGIGDLDDNEDINISANYAAGGYRVTGTGSGAANAFTVTDGSDTIAYAVRFNDSTGTAGNTAITAGTAFTGQTGAVSPLGNSTDNANYEVIFTEANLQAALAGTYTGVLTLTVQPE